MFTSSDPNLPDLDFELVDDQQQQQQHQQQTQNTYLNESMLKDLLSSGTSTYRIVKQPTTTTTTTAKRPGTNPLRRQLTDESPNKQRTPPNSTGTSLSPLSSAFFTRLSTSHENNPIRITNASNTIRMSSSATNNGSPTAKTLDAVTLLLRQTTAPSAFIQTLPTRLENPTKYHLEQISRKQTLVDDDCIISMSAPSGTMLSPPVQQEESSPDSEITSEMDDQLNDDTTCGSVDSSTRGISITPRLSMTLTGDALSSAYLSSSLSKDYLDSSSRHSSSCPTNILSAKAKIGLPLTDDEMRLVLRDRQKKDNHNMIERRRRFNINDRIKELGTLLPKGTELDLKQNKGTILRASVDYIKILRRQYDNVTLVGEKCQLLAEQNVALQERVKELERKCLSNGIPIQPSSSLINKSSPTIAVLSSSQVKQEPSSLSSSLNNNPNPLVPPSTPIFSGFDTFPPLDSPSAFGLVDDDSNDTNSAAGGNNPSASRDPLSPLGHDPFLSSTLFGFDNEMDIGGGFP